MKKSVRFFLFLFIALLAYAGLVWFQSNRLLNSSRVQDLLVQRVQMTTDGVLAYQGVEVGFLPQPTVTFLHPKLTFSTRSEVFEAEKLRFEFEIIPIAWGQTDPSAIYVFGGKTDAGIPWLSFLGELPFRNVTFKMGAIRANLAIPLQMTGDVGDQKQAVQMRGHFILPSTEKSEWEQISVRLLVDFKDLPLANQHAADPGQGSVFFFRNGSLNGSFEVKKPQGASQLDFTGSGDVKSLSYEVRSEKGWMTPPVLDIGLEVSGMWNPAEEELRIHKSKFQMPFGSLDMNGSVKFGTGEVPSLYFIAKDIVLENLVAYWPGIETALPFKIGFSGVSQWVLNLEGTLDHLSVHLNVDFNQTLLAYGNYFTKPKNVPLTITVDYLVQKGALFSGDFSVRFQDMSLKGNLTDLDIKAGTGQLNLLTNKFSLSGWEAYVPMLSNYKIQGDAKVLANWKGDLRELEKAEHIFHVTIEKGAWTREDGKGIRDANLSFDYSPLMLEGRDMQFEVGGSQVVADLRITGLQDKLQSVFHMSSGELVPGKAWDDLTALFRNEPPKEGVDIFERVRTSITDLFPGDQTLKDFTTDVTCSDGVWDISRFHGQFYGGIADLTGSLDLSSQPFKYRSEGEIKGLNIDLFLNRAGGEAKWLEGSSLFKFSVEGTGWGKESWIDSLTGRGRFTVTGGRFGSIELIRTIASIETFSELPKMIPEPNAFSELDFDWGLSKGKITTENFLVKSPDYVVDGEGTLDFDGLLNLRGDIFLPASLAADLFPSMAGTFHKESKAHLGPITLLISGPVVNPEIKPDPAQARELMDKINERKAKALLFELVLD